MLMKISLHISNNIKSKTQDREGKNKKKHQTIYSLKAAIHSSEPLQFLLCHFNGPSRGRPALCLTPISPCLLPVVAFSNFTHIYTIAYIVICQKRHTPKRGHTHRYNHTMSYSDFQMRHTWTTQQLRRRFRALFFLWPLSESSLFGGTLLQGFRVTREGSGSSNDQKQQPVINVRMSLISVENPAVHDLSLDNNTDHLYSFLHCQQLY